jgi:DNA gyrase subunit B
MNPDQLWETTMTPNARTMRQVAIEDGKERIRCLISDGKRVEPRKRFIQVHASSVKNLDI